MERVCFSLKREPTPYLPETATLSHEPNTLSEKAPSTKHVMSLACGQQMVCCLLLCLIHTSRHEFGHQGIHAFCTGRWRLSSTDLPPVHPVLTSQALVPCWSIFSANMEAYFMGCHSRKAPPKQALKVASGSVMPCSVPATCTAAHVMSHGHVSTVRISA